MKMNQSSVGFSVKDEQDFLKNLDMLVELAGGGDESYGNVIIMDTGRTWKQQFFFHALPKLKPLEMKDGVGPDVDKRTLEVVESLADTAGELDNGDLGVTVEIPIDMNPAKFKLLLDRVNTREKLKGAYLSPKAEVAFLWFENGADLMLTKDGYTNMFDVSFDVDDGFAGKDVTPEMHLEFENWDKKKDIEVLHNPF